MTKRFGAAKQSGVKGNPLNNPPSPGKRDRRKERAAQRKASNEAANTSSLRTVVFWYYLGVSMRMGLYLAGVSLIVSGVRDLLGR